MPKKRWPRRSAVQPKVRHSARLTLFLLLLLMAAAGLTTMSLALRSLVTDYAASAARDEVVIKVNEIVQDVMRQAEFTETSFVDLERDSRGNISAVSANVVAVNMLASEVLSRAVQATEHEMLTVKIPLVNLLGSAILMNHGPSIDIHVTMLSSSSAGFRSELTGAGINQTRHQLFLDLDIQLSFLLPWRTAETSVQTEVLVSETVIVGEVPNSYMNWER